MDTEETKVTVFDNIPLEVLIPFAVNCVLAVIKNLRAILVPVTECLEANCVTIKDLEQLLNGVNKEVKAI